MPTPVEGTACRVTLIRKEDVHYVGDTKVIVPRTVYITCEATKQPKYEVKDGVDRK